MKILIVHNYYQQAGGEDAVVREEAELLTRHGEDVSLFTAHNEEINGLWKKILTWMLTPYNPFFQRRFAERLRRDRPDIVHVHNFFPLFSPSVFYACARVGIPSVMTLHNFRVLCPTCFLYHDEKVRERSLHNPCWWTIPKKVYRNSYIGTVAVAAMVELHKHLMTWHRSVDGYIALTRFAKEKFEEGGLPPERIFVKGNAISMTAGAGGGPRHGAIFVGRLSDEKGIRTLIEAWRGIDYPLKIVGDGPLRGYVKENAGNRIEYCGYLPRNEVYAEMRKASFLILPSVWYEMFPVVAIDAFACSLPVVASRLSSLKDVIEHGVNGLHFNVSDKGELLKITNWAISHPEEMAQYGLNARKAFEEKYTSEINYRSLMNIYRNIIKKHKAER